MYKNNPPSRGKESFQAGLHNYLEKFSYSNAEGQDLWKSIAKSSGKPVDRIMESWVKREGYPILKLTYDSNKIKISQSRFYLDGREGRDIWPVPLTILRETGVESILMETREITIPAEGFVKLNVEETGFYRVLYPEEFYAGIHKKSDKLDYRDFIGILSDLYSFVVSGKIGLKVYLDVVSGFSASSDLNVVTQISNDLSELRNILTSNKALDEAYLNFHREQVKRLETKKSTDVNDSILYGTVLRRLVDIDDEKAKEMAAKFQNMENEIPDLMLFQIR